MHVWMSFQNIFFDQAWIVEKCGHIACVKVRIGIFRMYEKRRRFASFRRTSNRRDFGFYREVSTSSQKSYAKSSRLSFCQIFGSTQLYELVLRPGACNQQCWINCFTCPSLIIHVGASTGTFEQSTIDGNCDRQQSNRDCNC